MANAAAGEGEGVACVALFANQAVVENVAAFVEEEDVAGTAVPNRANLRGIQPLQKFQRIGAGDDHLAQRAHVHDGDRFAHGPIFAVGIAVAPGPPPAAAALHLRPQAAVLGVQRGAGGGLMVGSRGHFAQGELPGARASGKRRLERFAFLQQKAAQVGQADRALAGAGPGQRGPLDQLHLVETLRPNRL